MSMYLSTVERFLLVNAEKDGRDWDENHLQVKNGVESGRWRVWVHDRIPTRPNKAQNHSSFVTYLLFLSGKPVYFIQFLTHKSESKCLET